ncbi:MAG: hypothetical protein EA380_08995 [Phycisphaeraceae bacterium]|nr:MAG: hypothetical protein EA380_08995 [Phycisphaeraceae bacterium]
MNKPTETLREKFSRRFLSSDMPIIVYAVMAGSIVAVWSAQAIAPDLAMNLFSELLGAAFTLFIIDTLLVRTKARRWKVVSRQIDYLIARTGNRLRDGMATRIFRFVPDIDPEADKHTNLASIRRQRETLFNELSVLSESELEQRIDENEVFSERMYEYLNEKAEDIWDILNMKYSEYLAPELVSLLMDLHTNLRDTAAHIRQYRKADRFTDEIDKQYYRGIGAKGITLTLKAMLDLVNQLKNAGYSEAAPIAAAGN